MDMPSLYPPLPVSRVDINFTTIARNLSVLDIQIFVRVFDLHGRKQDDVVVLVAFISHKLQTTHTVGPMQSLPWIAAAVACPACPYEPLYIL